MKYLRFSFDKSIEVIQTLMLKSVILKMVLLPKKTDECNITLKTIHDHNVDRQFFSYLNYMRKKFELLAAQIKDKINILMVLETEID